MAIRRFWAEYPLTSCQYAVSCHSTPFSRVYWVLAKNGPVEPGHRHVLVEVVRKIVDLALLWAIARAEQNRLRE